MTFLVLSHPKATTFMKSRFLCTILLAVCSQLGARETPPAQAVNPFPKTGVTFHTSDAQLQRLFDSAEAKELGNIVQFTPSMKALVEGGGYNNVWIETQPMGGEMYAKRNPEVALNNQLVFMLTQRTDGRLPGMVTGGQTLSPHYEMFQGYCFPDPAWKMYFWCGKDKSYLLKLYKALEAHDQYLWRTRRSPKYSGLLESWCVWDTGDDNSTRLTTRGVSDAGWDSESRPTGGHMPLISMDVTAYSYAGRATLAKIAHELGNGQERFWQQQAMTVQKALIDGLWNPDRHACFDRDGNGKPLNELIHNNIRVMYHGMFTQEMANEFIRFHLLNPAEFWTPMPLPSIAVNETLFRNNSANDWSGQPEALTYQRALRALENYGHFAELTMLGRKFIAALGQGERFTQQFDPFTGKTTDANQDGYGPAILATLEYVSRMTGIHLDVEHGQVWWSALADDGKEFTYTQRWGDKTWTITCEKGNSTARVNERIVFSCTSGVRVVTDLAGKVIEVVGIDPKRNSITLTVGNDHSNLTVAPNHVYGLKGEVLRAAPFDYPYRGR